MKPQILNVNALPYKLRVPKTGGKHADGKAHRQREDHKRLPRQQGLEERYIMDISGERGSWAPKACLTTWVRSPQK